MMTFSAVAGTLYRESTRERSERSGAGLTERKHLARFCESVRLTQGVSAATNGQGSLCTHSFMRDRLRTAEHQALQWNR